MSTILSAYCDITILSDGLLPQSVSRGDDKRYRVSLAKGEVYSLKVKNKIKNNAPFVLHLRANVMVLDPIVVGPGDDIVCPLPRTSEWLRRQAATADDAHVEKIYLDIYPLKCWVMRESERVPYIGIVPFGSRRMHLDDLLQPQPGWSTYLTLPPDVSVAYVDGPPKPSCSTSVLINLIHLPSEIDNLREQVTKLENDVKQSLDRLRVSQDMEASLRSELEQQKLSCAKLCTDLRCSEQLRTQAEEQRDAETEFKLMTTSCMERLQAEVATLRERDTEMREFFVHLGTLDAQFNDTLEERRQLLMRVLPHASGPRMTAMSPLKRKISDKELEFPDDRYTRQRMLDSKSDIDSHPDSNSYVPYKQSPGAQTPIDTSQYPDDSPTLQGSSWSGNSSPNYGRSILPFSSSLLRRPQDSSPSRAYNRRRPYETPISPRRKYDSYRPENDPHTVDPRRARH